MGKLSFILCMTALTLGACSSPPAAGPPSELATAEAQEPGTVEPGFQPMGLEAADPVEMAVPIAQTPSDEELARQLQTTQDDGQRRAIVRDLAERNRRLPVVFGAVLVDLSLTLAGWEGDDRAAAAFVLGQAMDRRVLRKVAALAADEQHSRDQRLLLIEGIGCYRHPEAAESLVKLAESSREPWVAPATTAALTRMTGDGEPGDDPARWRRWVDSRAAVSPSEWLQQLMNEWVARQQRLTQALRREQEQGLTAVQAEAAALRASQREAVLALIESRRRLYRVLLDEEQTRAISLWLVEPYESARLLALELLDQRQTAGQAPSEPLVEEVRNRMDDSSGEVRRRAAELLWKLADAPAADRVAERLSQGQESHPAALRADLLLLERLPRRQAVPAIIGCLDVEELRARAAAALAAAIDANLATPEQVQRSAMKVRSLLPSNMGAPAPEMITLLSRFADESDWRRIAGWLDIEDGLAKEAAARAWARFGRPLIVLAERSGDVHIRQIAYNEIARRGDDAETMYALLDRPPADERAAADWRRAILAMAERVPLECLAQADAKLARQPETTELRRGLLAVGVTRIVPNANVADPEQAVPSDQASVLVGLLLSRAELELDAGEVPAAAADLDRIARLSVALQPAEKTRFDLASLEVRLSGGNVDGALTLARNILSAAEEPHTRADVRLSLIERCLASARRLTATGQSGRALDFLRRVERLLGADIPADWRQRVEAATTQAIIPPTTAPNLENAPTPTGQPAPMPTTPATTGPAA